MKNLIALFLLILMISCDDHIHIEDEYLSVLDSVRDDKKDELTAYFQLLEQSLLGVKDDGPLISSFFELEKIYSAAKRKEQIRSDKSFEELEQIIFDSYFERFMMFNNILFINLEGDVFYSLQKQTPLMDNLFSDEYVETQLSQSLINNPLAPAVDFSFFVSDDPSAFFVYPVIQNERHIGWCAFQFISNKLDMLFSVNKSIGETGEVFLVNENSYMLTDSSFSPEKSVLKLHLSDDNIARKFELKNGHLEVVDYRGHKAISSFEVYPFLNLNWLLIAKMDLDEVYTIEYGRDPLKYYRQIREKTLERQVYYLQDKPDLRYENEVHLDQFKRVTDSGALYTHGVSSCTAVVVTLPERFTYMAHISAYDALYDGDKTDIINNLLGRIKKYEIPDYLLRELKIYIITPQISFSQNIFNRLIDHGILLSQIYLIKNDDADFTNVYHDHSSGQTIIEWHLRDGSFAYENKDGFSSVGEIMMDIY